MFTHHPHSIFCLPIHYNFNKKDSIFYKKNIIPLGAKTIFVGVPAGMLPKLWGF
jgi:hypothetical protein